MTEEKLLTTVEAAAFLSLSPSTLIAARCPSAKRGLAIPFVKVGGRAVRYRQSDLEAFVAARIVTPKQ